MQYLASHKGSRALRNVLVALLVTAVPFGLILKEPDLGTALMFVPILFILLYIWGAPLRYLLSMIFCGVLFSPLAWFLLKDYQKERLLVFMDPGIDPLGAGYTIIQSKIAIGSGGLFGKPFWCGQTGVEPSRRSGCVSLSSEARNARLHGKDGMSAS